MLDILQGVPISLRIKDKNHYNGNWNSTDLPVLPVWSHLLSPPTLPSAATPVSFLLINIWVYQPYSPQKFAFSSHLPPIVGIGFFFLFKFLKRFYLFIHERHRERDTGKGEADSMQGARYGTWSQDSRIMLWAKGRRSTTEPPRHPA